MLRVYLRFSETYTLHHEERCITGSEPFKVFFSGELSETLHVGHCGLGDREETGLGLRRKESEFDSAVGANSSISHTLQQAAIPNRIILLYGGRLQNSLLASNRIE